MSGSVKPTDANALRGASGFGSFSDNSVVSFGGDGGDGQNPREGRMVFACSTDSNRKLKQGEIAK